MQTQKLRVVFGKTRTETSYQSKHHRLHVFLMVPEQYSVSIRFCNLPMAKSKIPPREIGNEKIIK